MKKALFAIAVLLVAPTTAAIIVNGALALQEMRYKHESEKHSSVKTV